MANGFRKIQVNFNPRTPISERIGFSVDNARILTSSRYIADDLELDDYEPPIVDATISKTRRQGRLLVTLNLKDNTGLRAALIFRMDGSARVLKGMPLRGRSMTERELIEGGINDSTREFRVLVTDNGGNTTTKRIPLKEIK